MSKPVIRQARVTGEWFWKWSLCEYWNSGWETHVMYVGPFDTAAAAVHHAKRTIRP